MRYLSHKTGDLIYRHNYEDSPLHLFGGYPDEFESLMWYVDRVAREKGRRFKIVIIRRFTNEVIIYMYPENSYYKNVVDVQHNFTEKDELAIQGLLNR